MTASQVWAVVVALLAAVLAGAAAAADTSLGALTPVAADELVREGRRGAAQVAKVVADPARYLATAVAGRLFGEVVAATAVTAVVAVGRHPGVWGLLGVAVATFVVLVVVSEAAPRTAARQHTVAVACATAGPLLVVGRVLGPVPRLLILAGNALTPGKGSRQGPFTSEAELRALVDSAERARLIEDDERQMIHSVFELGDTLAREVMVPRTDMVVIEAYKTLVQTRSLALRSGFSRIPVVGEDADDVVGVAYLKDVVAQLADSPQETASRPVSAVMRPAAFVPDSKPADELLREMQARRTHLVIVVDEYGGTAGLVTIEDILEEIVGEIADEYDTERPEVEELADGDTRVSARLNVADFADLLGLSLDPDDLDEVDTVGGLLAARLGTVPIAGSTVTVDGLLLTAESLEGRRNRIGTVLVHRLPAAGAPAPPTQAGPAPSRAKESTGG